MLVLTRKKGEIIMIGDQIELVVLGMEGDAVKLGVSAPRQIQVYRKEIYDAIKQSNTESSRPVWDEKQLAQFFKATESEGED